METIKLTKELESKITHWKVTGEGFEKIYKKSYCRTINGAVRLARKNEGFKGNLKVTGLLMHGETFPFKYDLRFNMKTLICNDCKSFHNVVWYNLRRRCTCGCTVLTETHPSNQEFAINPKLKDWVPHEFFLEYMDTRAAKLLDYQVIEQVNRYHQMFDTLPFKHKHIYNWCIVSNGTKTYAVAWNENPSRGWSFPVKKLN